MLTVDWHQFAMGEHRIPCPSCGRGKTDKTAGLKIDHDGGVLHCYRCQLVQTFRPERGIAWRATAAPARQAQPAKRTSLDDWGLDFWRQCRPVDGVAASYLRSRRCVIPPADGDLRWHPAVKHAPSGYVGAALVALVTDVLTGKPLTLHRTWITPTGKASVDPVRMLLGGYTSKGGCIRLYPEEFVVHGLALGEGIETCLSLAHGFAPVWATIDAGHLADFPVIPGVEALTICRDNDPAGIAAAHECSRRWTTAGKTVRVTQQDCNDINDLLTEVDA